MSKSGSVVALILWICGAVVVKAQYFPTVVQIELDANDSDYLPSVAPSSDFYPGLVASYQSNSSARRIDIIRDYSVPGAISYITKYFLGSTLQTVGTYDYKTGLFSISGMSLTSCYNGLPSSSDQSATYVTWPGATNGGPPAVTIKGTVHARTGGSGAQTDTYGTALTVTASSYTSSSFGGGSFVDGAFLPNAGGDDIRPVDVLGVPLIPCTPPSWGPPAILVVSAEGVSELWLYAGGGEYQGPNLGERLLLSEPGALGTLGYTIYFTVTDLGIPGSVSGLTWLDSSGSSVAPAHENGSPLTPSTGLPVLPIEGVQWLLYDSVKSADQLNYTDYYTSSLGYPTQLMALDGRSITIVEKSSLLNFIPTPRAAPYFLASCQIFEEEYTFLGGADDPQGNHLDLLSNGEGDFVTISGTYDSATLSGWGSTNVGAASAPKGSLAGTMTSGILTIPNTVPFSKISHYTISGNLIYSFQSGSQDGQGSCSDLYNCSNGGWFILSGTYQSGPMYVTGSDPTLGSFSGTVSSTGELELTYTETGNSLAPANLYVNGMPFTFTSGSVGPSGDLVEKYASGAGYSMTISGTVDSAQVVGNCLTGVFSGTISHGNFNISGVVVSTTASRATPVFASDSLVVNGIIYTFAFGAGDGDAMSSDIYESGTGDFMTLSGNTTSGVNVVLNLGSSSFQGTWSNAGFNVSGATILTPLTTPSLTSAALAVITGPGQTPALFQFVYGSYDGTNSTDYYRDSAADLMVISGNASSASVKGTLSGAAFSGSFSNSAFLMGDSAQVIPVRTTPVFSNRMLIAGGVGYIFGYGTDAGGVETDYYNAENGAPYSITITGTGGNDAVSIVAPGGTYNGAFEQGTFAVPGLSVGVARGEPKFVGKVIVVDGVNYNFTYGVDDGLGDGTDNYSAGAGYDLSLTSTGQGNPVLVSLAAPTGDLSGTETSGVFSVPGISIVNGSNALPGWWSSGTTRVLQSNVQPNDFGTVNQGQLKNIAMAAIAELDSKLPNGAGSQLGALLEGWLSPSAGRNDFAVMNLGQVKSVAKPIYDRLLQEGYAYTYPWSGSANPSDDYALANIGQVKNLFGFSVNTPVLAGGTGTTGTGSGTGTTGTGSGTGTTGTGSGTGTTGTGSGTGTTGTGSGTGTTGTGSGTGSTGTGIITNGYGQSATLLYSPLVQLDATGYALP